VLDDDNYIVNCVCQMDMSGYKVWCVLVYKLGAYKCISASFLHCSGYSIRSSYPACRFL